ncbi:hypothetical protein [Paracoccus sp. (in: a-proteobacteria)]|uniref:hypothetical protein n=1 Tax=Paracoccus sp. TaxID=267 RepID=UPI00396C79A6
MPDNSLADDIARPAHVLTPLMPIYEAPGRMRAPSGRGHGRGSDAGSGVTV